MVKAGNAIFQDEEAGIGNGHQPRCCLGDADVCRCPRPGRRRLQTRWHRGRNNACAVQAFQGADTEIAVLYGDVMRALSAHERPQLRQEHTAWQRERTTRCKQAQRSNESQPQWPRLYHECLTAETQARRKGLMRWLTLDHPSATP